MYLYVPVMFQNNVTAKTVNNSTIGLGLECGLKNVFFSLTLTQLGSSAICTCHILGII